MKNKYIVHLPHCGVEIPQKYRDDYYLSDAELEENIYQYADYKTEELYGGLTKKFESVINPYSRLFMDPERFFDDELESMQVKHGLGWFYENTILEKKPLRSTKNKDEIAYYYHAHHEKLTKLVDEKLDIFDECIIFDCHSFSNERYWFHDKDISLPDICIGFDEYHKDEKIVELLLESFKDYDVAINSPYAGSLVPTKHYMKDARVKSVMIEVNKKLYLEDDNKTLNKEFVKLRESLGDFFADKF
ncbi:MAG: N-formylglutamate amidohydrolase [Campylobacterales bacterium]|nr:N-formylglutamate amidohydrolase [Campylobacterales bacterium]